MKENGRWTKKDNVRGSWMKWMNICWLQPWAVDSCERESGGWGAKTSDNYVNNWLNDSEIGVNINSKMIPWVFYLVYEVGEQWRFKKYITRRRGFYFYAMLTTSRPAFTDQKISLLFKTCHFISSTFFYLM